MTASTSQTILLSRGILLAVDEDLCQIVGDGHVRTVRYATLLPSPRKERLSPGHLVAVASAPKGTPAVIWRWYDAVVTGEEAGSVQLWEPAHGSIVARPRFPERQLVPGTRAYVSAGLPGAEWWVGGPAVVRAEEADVDLDEVERFYTEHDLWHAIE